MNNELARINADGTCQYDWPLIEATAAKWEPFCTDYAIGLSKLLMGIRTHHTVTETGYRIAEFHHADDANFCDVAHGLMPQVIAALEAALSAKQGEQDAARLNWLEDSHTLHKAVEFLYVVDGFEVQHTYDDNPVGNPIHGETLREAIDNTMKGQP